MEKKRFLAVVMTVMMIISMVPSMVFAAAPSGELGGKLKVKGLAAVGTTVNADYTKVTPEGVTDEDFTFSWSRQTEEKELTQVGTEKAYTITQDDLGYRLVLVLTPVDGSGLTGTLTAKTWLRLKKKRRLWQRRPQRIQRIHSRQKLSMEQRTHSWKRIQRTQIIQKIYSRMGRVNKRMILRIRKVSWKKHRRTLKKTRMILR